MIYRNRVEFAVGHGVAVHAETSDDVTLATEVRTTVMPQYEVQVTETPGLDPSDRPAMHEMVSSGLLDMRRLATLDIDPLVDALSMLTKDYAEWIDEQRARVGSEITGYDTQSQQAMDRCQEINTRLQQGIDTLKNDEKALAAFRFANQSMATQRVRSQYALAMRRGEDVTIDKFDVLKNRSWRPFQLAFLLLSIPSLADPSHPDRVQPVEAYADLLWFPTGGGKTEAYLGVAAFTMAIRRMQATWWLRQLTRLGCDHALYAAPVDATAVPARNRIDLCDGGAPSSSVGSRRQIPRHGTLYHRPVGWQQGYTGYNRG